MQVILGGRDIAVQAARLPAQTILHVLPYHVGNADEFETGKELLKRADRGRNRWWQNYGKLTGDDYTSLPKALQTGQLEEVTAQPLLNYLLALSYRRGQLDFSLSPSLNEIYRDLLDAVYERPWGEGDHPAKRQLRKEEFNYLLDELGLAAWHGEGRTVTEVTLIEACARAGLSEQLERFKEGAKSGAIGLLAAFYFREAGKLQEANGRSSSPTRASVNTWLRDVSCTGRRTFMRIAYSTARIASAAKQKSKRC